MTNLEIPDPSLLELKSVEVDNALRLPQPLPRLHRKALCPRANSHLTASIRTTKTLMEYPRFGQRVKWIIQVRCLNPECSRKLFSERLPTCAPAYARRTLRQGEALSEMACTLGERGDCCTYEYEHQP